MTCLYHISKFLLHNNPFPSPKIIFLEPSDLLFFLICLIALLTCCITVNLGFVSLWSLSNCLCAWNLLGRPLGRMVLFLQVSRLCIFWAVIFLRLGTCIHSDSFAFHNPRNYWKPEVCSLHLLCFPCVTFSSCISLLFFTGALRRRNVIICIQPLSLYPHTSGREACLCGLFYKDTNSIHKGSALTT